MAVEILPDGTIRLTPAPARPVDEFELTPELHHRIML
jgi:hypothetical protein